MLLSLLGLGFASPYLSCASLEKAWDGQECVGISSAGDNANELASLHNAVLENDGQVREDSYLTSEDTAEFLEVGAAFACADGACDAGEVSAVLQEKASSFLEDGFDPVEDLGMLLEETVKAGRLSADEADFLELLVEDAESGRYTDAELQARIEEDVPKWEDPTAARGMLAVSRASYEYWGGAKVRPGGEVVDAVTTLVLFLNGVPGAGVLGAWVSGLYEGYHPWYLHHLRSFSWSNVTEPFSFSETLWDGTQFYTVEGGLTADEGWVQLRNADGETLDERTLDRATPFGSTASSKTAQNTAAKGRPLEIRIWLHGGWLVLVVQNGVIRDAWFLE